MRNTDLFDALLNVASLLARADGDKRVYLQSSFDSIVKRLTSVIAVRDDEELVDLFVGALKKFVFYSLLSKELYQESIDKLVFVQTFNPRVSSDEKETIPVRTVTYEKDDETTKIKTINPEPVTMFQAIEPEDADLDYSEYDSDVTINDHVSVLDSSKIYITNPVLIAWYKENQQKK